MNLLQNKKNKKNSTQPSDVLKTTDDYSPAKTEKVAVIPQRVKQDVPHSNGKFGVRNSMVNAGLDNSRIGYDGEYVTYNGARVLKPDFETEGTSYADSNDINTAINNAYRTEGKEIAPVTDLAGAYGVPEYAFKYNNGNVYLGGRNIPVAYESDGSSYAVSDDIKAAADWYKDATGIKNYGDIRDDYEGYKTKINSLLKDYEAREGWNYDPQSDPAYLAYAQAAQREGKKAYEDALAGMSARTGGYMNTAAVSAANEGLNYYMSQLQDKIPELMRDSYERYSEELGRERDYIGMINDMANKYLSNDLNISDDAYERQRQNGMDEYGRKNAAGEQYRNAYYTDLYDDILGLEMAEKGNNIHSLYLDNMFNEAALPYASGMAEQEYERAVRENAALDNESRATELKMQGQEIENKTAKAEQMYKNAVIRGYFTDEEAEFLKLDKKTNPVTAYRTFMMLGKK